jgi:seryl-tRNA synthetase
LGESLGIIDFERGVKLSGTRFYILRGLGARLQRAVIAYMLDMHTLEHGYKEIYPPYMVKKEMLVGSGQLPKFIDNLYHDVEEDYWWVPTAEVPLTNLHRDEIIPPGMLPFYYVAYTACFRREKT